MSKAYYLTANKTKLYALAKHFHPDIEPMRRTRFVKHYRSRSYSLDFRSGEAAYHHMFLSVCGGRPTLGDELTLYLENDERMTDWNATTLTLDECRAYGLLEEVEK